MTTTYLFANNAKSTLAAGINTSATTVTLSTGTGALFPSPGADELFTLSLTDSATGTLTEIMFCTGRTGDVCTVVRAQEGTTALNWETGDFANNFFTAGTAAALQDTSGPSTSVAVVNPIPPGLPMPQDVVRFSGNPVLSPAGSGFDAGSVRDNDLLFARGKLWMFYTGASIATSPYNPTIGLATSVDEGETWTRQGQVVPANTTPGQWNSGAIFSPCTYYDEATDELYLYVSGTETGDEWYTGPIAIGVLKAAAGADWTDPTSYVYQNSGAPIITVTQSWEGSQGVYSPSVKFLGGQFVMLYSSSGDPGTGYAWHIGRATADDPVGPWTKYTSNPVITAAEEPSMLQLYGGTLIALCDNLDASSGMGAYGMAVWQCSSQDGLGVWTKTGLILTTGAQSFDSRAIGSGAGVLMDDGTLVIIYNGAASGAPDDRRSIGRASGLIQLNVALDVVGINALIAAALAGAGGSGDPLQRYVQFHLQSLPGGIRIFDLGPRKRVTAFTGTIGYSTSNPLFGTVEIRSAAGNGSIGVAFTAEYNIGASEDWTVEMWVRFDNTATANEMLLEFNVSGLAIYRRSDGFIEVAQSSVAAIGHDSTYVVVPSVWTFLVVQRTAGTMQFFHAVQGDAFMTAGDSYAANTTAYASTAQGTVLAGANGTSSFMHGDLTELRYSPGISRSYSSATPVPTTFLPT